METNKRTAEQLANGEKLVKELFAEGRKIYKQGRMRSEADEKYTDEEIKEDYELWKEGKDAPKFGFVFDLWSSDGMPTPAYDAELAVGAGA